MGDERAEAALTVRSRTHLARRGVVGQMLQPFTDPVSYGGGPCGPAAQPMRIVPIGQVFRTGSERASADLHVMSLVATPTQASIAVVIRMHWPSDGSSADLELSEAGYHHLPYDQLWLADDRGSRYLGHVRRRRRRPHLAGRPAAVPRAPAGGQVARPDRRRDAPACRTLKS